MKGIWPAVSGSIVQSQRLDVVANNLANVNTDGFKKSSIVFQQILSSSDLAQQGKGIPRRLYTEKDLHRLDGKDKAYVVMGGTFTDFSSGKIKVTGSPLDVAIDGSGFLEVLTPKGIRYSRGGSFRINPAGALVTLRGDLVLSKTRFNPQNAGQNLLNRGIYLDNKTPGSTLIINRNGEVYYGKKQVGELSVVDFVDKRLLLKEEGTLFTNKDNANINRDARSSGILQGMLETSNVNPIQELTALLKANRLFEANQNIIRNYGEIEKKAISDITK